MDFPPAIVHEIVIDHQAAASKHLAEMSPQDLDKDWKLNDLFGCFYVINLPQAKERLQKVTQNLHSIGLRNFKVFNAVDGRKVLKQAIWQKFWKNWHSYDLKTSEGRKKFDNQRKGEAGCFMRHYRVIKAVKTVYEEAMQQLQQARASGNEKLAALAAQRARRYSSVVVLEDDNGFGIINNDHTVSLAGCGAILRQAMQELPPDWDILYFACQSRLPTVPYSPHLVRMAESLFTNAYAVNHTMYQALYDSLKKIEDPTVKHLMPLDNEISTLFPGHRAFAIVPKLSYQSAGRSYITTDLRRLQ